MYVLADENTPRITVAVLRELGHDVRDLGVAGLGGAPDDQVWDLAQREGRTVVTTDKGFAQHRGEWHHGVLVVRLRQPNRRKIHSRVIEAIVKFDRQWEGLTVIVRDTVQSVWRTVAPEPPPGSSR